jgi:glucan phosphoethanolaminetransferase (alkaline phosphatase superfamily)
LNYYLFGIIPGRLLKKSNSKYLIKDAPNVLEHKPNRTIVLIIGESLREDRFRPEKNNPFTPNICKLRNEGKISYKKIYSGGTMTHVSIAVLINMLENINNTGQISKQENCLFKLAKNNGFETAFISMQTASELKLVRDIICTKYIDIYKTKDDCHALISLTGYDEDLVDMIVQNIDLSDKKNRLIVLQQRGSHSPYEKQYPVGFKVYEPYSNTVLYTDMVLDKLINYFEKNTNNELHILFSPDHGELLGENARRGHGRLEKEIYEVPFMMYTGTAMPQPNNDFNLIKSHFDLSSYISKLLGYNAFHTPINRCIYILNSDLDGFSGHGEIKVNIHGESPIVLHK